MWLTPTLQNVPRLFIKQYPNLKESRQMDGIYVLIRDTLLLQVLLLIDVCIKCSPRLQNQSKALMNA